MGDTVKKLEYGIADRAWQVCIGCSPKMPCSNNCWARKTEARTVECLRVYHPGRAGFYQRALTPDLKQWSGRVLIDEAHLNDPLHWRKPVLIATGFHGDIGRVGLTGTSAIFQVIDRCPQHRFVLLTKQPDEFLRWAGVLDRNGIGNATLGCSVMNQAEADLQRPAMAALAALGWHTHCWYEPALGPVDWRGWEFLELLICGGESGKDSRPMHPQWARNTRDWCQRNGVAFRMKQHGDWVKIPLAYEDEDTDVLLRVDGSRGQLNGEEVTRMRRVGKRATGNLLDGREHNGLPDWRRL